MPKKKQITRKPLAKIKKTTTLDLGTLDFEAKPEINSQSKQTKSRFRPTSLLTILILILIFFVLGSVIYKNKKWLVAGTINGRPVTSVELYARLTNQYGKQMLEQITVERLLKQEAVNRKIAVAQSDIDSEVKKIEESLGTTVTLNDALAQQGMTLQALHDQIRLRLTAVKLVEDKVQVTDADVEKYITENKDAITVGEDIAKQKENIKNFLKDQKNSEEIQKLIQELKTKAKINTYL